MERYETDVRGGVLYLEGEEGWLEVGSMDDVVELVGGETYAIQYDERQRTVSWLDVDEDGTLEFDVRDTVRGMSYDREFVDTIAGIDPDGTDDEGYPTRASVFADLMTTIWDSKGDLESGL